MASGQSRGCVICSQNGDFKNLNTLPSIWKVPLPLPVKVTFCSFMRDLYVK